MRRANALAPSPSRQISSILLSSIKKGMRAAVKRSRRRGDPEARIRIGDGSEEDILELSPTNYSQRDTVARPIILEPGRRSTNGISSMLWAEQRWDCVDSS